MASILMNATMVGICFTEAHQEMLYRRLENLVFQHMQMADSPLHEPGLIAVLGNSKGKPKAKAKGKAKNTRKRKTGKADEEEAEEEGEDDNEEGEEDEDDEASGQEEPEEEPEEEEDDEAASEEEGSAFNLIKFALKCKVSFGLRV